ncbi:hypothetical protein HU200_016423 [Digitaria exilis]|uniref:NB-ARC domain-containing protein n=1 Tax=Digitaria exilis TaxID=1010633 RepID=A0A835KHA1_9POAL|nr:hypothetical protein HU200_016423 [Digitaria exilis]
MSKPMQLDVEDCLCRVLLRAQVITEEAMGRHITNQAMLLQLLMLTDAMHRGYYTLDNFRYQPQDEEEAKDQAVSRSSSLSIVNYVKRLCFSGRGASALKEMQETLEKLSSMILDVNELVLFLTSYPRLYRQPYSMHLQLVNCMFGRQMESQVVINFLLCKQPHGPEELEVLPIIGPGYVGKSTLVAHACKVERVRDHFSEILFLQSHDFTDDELTTFTNECARKHQNHVSNSNKDMGFLVVVELVGDLHEDAWNRLYSDLKQCVPSCSKIIITSRSDKIAKFGTTQALTLKHFSNEAYWYFFKTLTFESIDPEMHPRLTYLAMEIAKAMRSSPLSAYITAHVLRDNFEIRFWCKVLSFFRGSFHKYASKYGGEHPLDAIGENKTTCIGRMAIPSEVCVLYHHHHQYSTEDGVPKITIQDVLYGNVKPRGKFEALAWRSSIPPYYSYVSTCEIQELKTAGVKRKRSMKDRVTLF